MVAQTLKKFRESLGLSQKEFAKKINVNATTYNNYENGIREPKSDFLISLYKKYGVSSDYLYGNTDIMYSTAKKNATFSDGNELDKNEQSLISTYRNITPKGQKVLLETAETLYNNFRSDD
ncbi:MAG: helix-turn-helix transcriptional regulator, partial [Oscillospiraceae bacterium]